MIPFSYHIPVSRGNGSFVSIDETTGATQVLSFFFLVKNSLHFGFKLPAMDSSGVMLDALTESIVVIIMDDFFFENTSC